MTKLESLKRGEYFLRKPSSKRVYVRGTYEKSSKRYECFAADDMNQFIYIKGSTLVHTEFEY